MTHFNQRTTILCPNCQQVVQLKQLSCGGRACLSAKHGVMRLMKSDFYADFNAYEQQFQIIREAEGLRIKDKSVYPKLPFLDNILNQNRGEWKAFRDDLAVVKNNLPAMATFKALNHGSWNGWLSNQLVGLGAELTAVGYFIDPYDGLGAQQFFHRQWLSIQMDIEYGLDILPNDYDLIVINRGISFLENPGNTVKILQEKLAHNGLLIITGLNVYKNQQGPRERFQEYRKTYWDKYQFDILFKPVKGYLSTNDVSEITELGVVLKPYPNKILQNIRAKWLPAKPGYFYGIYVKTEL